MNTSDFESYLSPFSWRYASDEMRGIWSEAHKRRLWRKIWLALAEVQAQYGLVRTDQVEDLRVHVDDVDVQRSLEIEAEIQHDLMAEIKAYAAQCPVGGGILHLGATSMDIEDNADVMRIKQSLGLILGKLGRLLVEFGEKIDRWADAPLMAFTHLQPAEPSTLGYRLAQYGQDLLIDRRALVHWQGELRGKGFKGAVGTAASYSELVGIEQVGEFEARLGARLGLTFFPVTSQTYPRKQDYLVISALAGLAGSIYKFAFDLRILQSPPFGEWSEGFGQKQVGSSAMPFKQNPVNAETLDSLARHLAQFPRLAWDNAAHSLLERTLDDKANRRVLLPEAFLISDELLEVGIKIVSVMQIDEGAMFHNLNTYAPFAATERVLMALVKAGADRQEMHERLREHAILAWKAIRQGRSNPLKERICQDEVFLSYLTVPQLDELLEATHHLGDAPQRARRLAQAIRSEVGAL